MIKNLLNRLADEEVKKLIKYCKDPEWTIGMRRTYKSKTEGYLEALKMIALELDLEETRKVLIEKDQKLIYLNVYTGEYERRKNNDK